MTTEFVKIKGSYYQLGHIIAVKRVKPFKDLGKKTIQYVVRLSEEAAGGDEPRFRNVWCTKADVEPFLHKMKGLPEPIEDPEDPENPEDRQENPRQENPQDQSPVSSDIDSGLQ